MLVKGWFIPNLIVFLVTAVVKWEVRTCYSFIFWMTFFSITLSTFLNCFNTNNFYLVFKVMLTKPYISFTSVLVLCWLTYYLQTGDAKRLYTDYTWNLNQVNGKKTNKLKEILLFKGNLYRNYSDSFYLTLTWQIVCLKE